ncbi:hypothetical protein [Sphingobacteruim zhuxiongii]|nr:MULTISPECIES: hypothetical protein [unclassified Sphingobacterium]
MRRFIFGILKSIGNVYFCEMLTATQTNMIQGDFEKFLTFLRSQKRGLDFDVFGDYAGSVLNFYMGSSLIIPADKLEAAKELTNLFNAGLKNIISKEDVLEIAESIAQDTSLDYSILQPIFMG